MKKLIFAAILTIAALTIGGYLIYRFSSADLISETILSDSLSPYIPERIQNKIKQIRTPLNKGTDVMLQSMQASHISVDQLLALIDHTTEEEAYALLEELNKTKPNSTNEVFNVAKKHFKADFDFEVFRKPFNRHVEMKQIRKAMTYANMNRKSGHIDFIAAKAILKRILIEKEEQFRLSSKQ